MKAVFYIGPQRDEWSLELFPGKSPGELQIAGKSWVRHAVDFCSLLKVSDVWVADLFFHKDLPHRMGNGDFWSLSLACVAVPPCGNPRDLLAALREELPIDETEEVLFFWGLVLPDVPEAGRVTEHLRPVDPVPEVLPDGIYLWRGGKLFECACLLFRFDTLKHYFDLNFRMLAHPGIYNLPGYATVDGCSIGMDVIIMLNCDLEKPVLISDNVCLEHGVKLHNGVIIGKDVLVDENSELDHSIILKHTYVGKNMCFCNKIVDGSRVIDAETGSLVDLEDRFLAGSTRDRPRARCNFTEWLFALGIGIAMFLPWLLTVSFRKFLARTAFFGFLHKIYPRCWHVLHGRAHLVRLGQNDQDYVFRYSDMWPLRQDEAQKELDDIYFYYHRTAGNIARVAVMSLLKRFFMLSSPDRPPAENAAKEGRAQ